MSRHERAAKVGAGLENYLGNDLENDLEQNASVQLDQEVAHSCPSSCGRSKYNCPVNMQNVLWRAIHQDKYDRLQGSLLEHHHHLQFALPHRSSPLMPRRFPCSCPGSLQEEL